MLHLLLGRDWTANRDAVMARIAGDVLKRKGNCILMVPELISHETERRLAAAAGDTASRYAEVLSFSRLARRVSDAMGSAALQCLDNGGRVVAMASSARQLASRLKAYAAVETKPEFLTGLIDAIDEFKRCCISSADLLAAAAGTEGSFAQKLEELSLLMETYDALCSQGKRDPRDEMTWLLEQLEAGSFGEEHTFYIDGFPDFTRQNMAILEHLIRVSPGVTISLNCDQVASSEMAFEKAGDTAHQLVQCAKRAGIAVDIRVIPEEDNPLSRIRSRLFQGAVTQQTGQAAVHTYYAETPYQECMGAAKQVMSLVAQGCRYRDIGLVCTDTGTYFPLIQFVFHRFGIPVYQAGTDEILDKSVIFTVLTALDAAISNFDQRSTLRYLRSALSPLLPDVCDMVENYAFIWGIRGQKWTMEWTNHPDGLSAQQTNESVRRLAQINEARSQAIRPLQALQAGFRDAVNLRQQVEVLYSFLEDIQLAPRLARMAGKMDSSGDNRSAQILNQLWDILLSALEQMYDVLGNTSWEPEQFLRLLRLLLSQYTVGTIPPVLDAVYSGPVSAMRCNQQRHLIILGAEEGKLPGYTGSSGVLTDQERVFLREMGVPLTGGATEGIQAEFSEIYGVFCGAEESIRLFCSGSQPSFLFRRLSEICGGPETVNTEMGFAQADAFETGAYLARWNASELAEALDASWGYEETCRRRNHGLGAVSREHIRALYGDTLRLSASQIDRQAECRLSYFLKYGLRAQELKEASIDPAEFGTYVHAVLECTARDIQELGGFHSVTLEETLEIAHRHSEAYAAQHFSQLDSQRVVYLFRRNIQELDMVVQELWLELKDALFEPVGFEVAFGGEGGLPPIQIENTQMNAILLGFIDRVDLWKSQGSSYFRVVDYKTGQKDFDYCDVINGVGLQMLLYLFALGSSGYEKLDGNAYPAGVQYFPARAPYLSEDGRISQELAEKKRAPKWKRQGLLLADEAVLQAMEPENAPRRRSDNLADRSQLQLLKKYIFRFLGGMVEEIASGYVEPNPYTRGTSHNACTFCPYGSICHKQTVSGRRSYKALSAEEFWNDIEKELSRNGR